MADTSIPGGGNAVDTQYRYSTTQSSAANDSLNMQDFLMLIVAQMQNQDMNSDQDNTQFMSQMAQMASMQAMQELTSAFMSSMSMSYLGKYAKASAFTTNEDGELQSVKIEGYVERVSFNGGEASVLIGDTWFKVSDVYEIGATKPNDDTTTNTGTE